MSLTVSICYEIGMKVEKADSDGVNEGGSVPGINLHFVLLLCEMETYGVKVYTPAAGC